MVGNAGVRGLLAYARSFWISGIRDAKIGPTHGELLGRACVGPRPSHQRDDVAESKRTGASWQKAACRQARIFRHRQQTIGRCCKCNPWVAISGDQWPDDVRLSIEQRFTCQTCGTRELTSGRIFYWERKNLRAVRRDLQATQT